MFWQRGVLVWFSRLLSVVVGIGLLTSGVALARRAAPPRGASGALGSAFTYQGRLTDGGNPANGSYDFQFRLYDAATGGSQVGSTVTKASVNVTEGLFTVSLDFGGVFDGTALWLEIAVRPAGSGNYTTLSPRQALTAAPYALYAASAPWSGLSNLPAGFADGVDDDTMGGLSCASGQVAKWNGSAWTCSADADSGGDITTVNAGAGLSGGGTSGSVTVTLDTTYTDGRYYTQSALQTSGQAQVHWGNLNNVPAGLNDGDDDTLGGLSCASGQVAKWNGSAWTCGADADSGGDITTVNAGAGLSGGGTSGSVTMTLDTAYIDSRYWKLTGNAGTSPTTHFLGTVDQVTLTLRVSDTVALRLEPTTGTPNVIGGYSGNSAGAGVVGAVVGGGGTGVAPNQVTGNYATVGGGSGNTASGRNATVSGGQSNTASNWYTTVGGGSGNVASGERAIVGGGGDNTASGNYATVGGGGGNTAGGSATVSGGLLNTASGVVAAVGGGSSNEASGGYATVGGGYVNTASSNYATVSGGRSNTASGAYATVSGGYGNTASGVYSFAAGRTSRADHDGAFVWGDNTAAAIHSPAADTFVVRANGGVWFGQATTELTPTLGTGVFISTSTGAYLSTGGTWTNASDRNLKEHFAPVDHQAVLEKVAQLPITTWNYRAQDASVRHMGPVAQDFYAAFGLGEDNTHISTVDAAGVSLAAIQALYERNQALEAENAALQAQLGELERRVAALEQGRDGSTAASPWLGVVLLGLALVWGQGQRSRR